MRVPPEMRVSAAVRVEHDAKCCSRRCDHEHEGGSAFSKLRRQPESSRLVNRDRVKLCLRPRDESECEGKQQTANRPARRERGKSPRPRRFDADCDALVHTVRPLAHAVQWLLLRMNIRFASAVWLPVDLLRGSTCRWLSCLGRCHAVRLCLTLQHSIEQSSRAAVVFR